MGARNIEKFGGRQLGLRRAFYSVRNQGYASLAAGGLPGRPRDGKEWVPAGSLTGA